MKLFLISMTLLCANTIVAQQAKIDSLIAVNNNYHNNDSVKVILLTNIFKQYTRLGNFDKVIEYSDKAIEVAKKLPRSNSLSKVYERLGLCYHGVSRYIEAENAYKNGLDVAKQRGDKFNSATFYVDLSALYLAIPDYTKSLESSQQAIDLYFQLGNKNDISSCYMNMGLTYIDINEPIKANTYINKALVNFLTTNNGIHYGVASAYQGLAKTITISTPAQLTQLGITTTQKNATIIGYLNKALNVAKTANESILVGEIHTDIANFYEKTGNNTAALDNYNSALLYGKPTGNKEQYATINYNLGNFYLNRNDYANSLVYLHKSLAVSNAAGVQLIKQNTLQKLSELHQQKGQFDSAFYYYQQYTLVKETIFNQKKEQEITRKQLQIDFSIKENDYKYTQQLTDAKLGQQMLFTKQQQQALTLKQQQLQLTQKEKDLQQLSYLKTQAALQNEQKLQASMLQKNKLQAKFDKEVSGKQIAKQQLQISFDKTLKNILMLAIGLAFIVAGLFFYNYKKTAKLNKIIGVQKTELEQLGQVKDKIFSIVSHDMRAPVNSLMSFINILDAGEIPQQKLALYSQNLKQNLTYTSSLMNNLLHWAASQMQGFKPYPEVFHLKNVVAEVANTLEHHLQQKQVVIQINIDESITIKTDRNMLSAILRNLISNAIKFSFKNTIVSINFKQQHNGVFIHVVDAGTGVSNEQLQQLNQHTNYAADSKRGTENEKGTGLGLMLCKTFCQQMGGKLKVNNNANSGATCSVWLPN